MNMGSVVVVRSPGIPRTKSKAESNMKGSCSMVENADEHLRVVCGVMVDLVCPCQLISKEEACRVDFDWRVGAKWRFFKIP